VPNDLTLKPLGIKESDQAPEDMTDYHEKGHGTGVAGVVAGKIRGVASKANLFIVKFRNAAKNALKPDDDTLVIRGVTEAALQDAWDFCIDDIISRQEEKKKANQPVERSIISR